MRSPDSAPENSITEGVIWKTLLKFFFPILFGTFFQQMYNTVDAIIVGKYVGKAALAAVGGSTGNLVNLIVGFFVGLSSGSTVVLSQYFGARNAKGVNRTVHTAILFAICCASVLTLVGIFFSPVFLGWMNTPEQVLDYAVPYIRIYFAGMIPSMIYNVGSGLLRAAGDSRRPLYFLMSACVTNIILDIVLVVGADLGVSGAAIATILSQTVSAVLVVITLMRDGKGLRLEPKRLRISGDILRKIMKIGLPAGIQSVLFSISNVLVQTSVNSFGTDVVAAFSAFAKIDGFYWMILNAFGISITTFVGQNFGAGKIDRVKKSLRVCMAITAGTTAVYSLVIVLLREPVFRLFTDDGAVLAYGIRMVMRISPTYLFYICIEMFSGTMRGTGDSIIPTVLMLFGICVLRVTWIELYIPTHHDIDLVLLCYPMTWLITSLLFLIYYLKGGWLKRSMHRAGLA